MSFFEHQAVSPDCPDFCVGRCTMKQLPGEKLSARRDNRNDNGEFFDDIPLRQTYDAEPGSITRQGGPVRFGASVRSFGEDVTWCFRAGWARVPPAWCEAD